MESRTKHPISHLLVVNHDPRLRKESYKAVLDSEFDGCGPAVVRTTCAPQIQRGTVSLELPNVLNDARHRNPGCTTGSHKRVINIDVNNHDSDETSGLGERSGSPTPGRRCPIVNRDAIPAFGAAGWSAPSELNNCVSNALIRQINSGHASPGQEQKQMLNAYVVIPHCLGLLDNQSREQRR